MLIIHTFVKLACLLAMLMISKCQIPADLSVRLIHWFGTRANQHYKVQHALVNIYLYSKYRKKKMLRVGCLADIEHAFSVLDRANLLMKCMFLCAPGGGGVPG